MVDTVCFLGCFSLFFAFVVVIECLVCLVCLVCVVCVLLSISTIRTTVACTPAVNFVRSLVEFGICRTIEKSVARVFFNNCRSMWIMFCFVLFYSSYFVVIVVVVVVVVVVVCFVLWFGLVSIFRFVWFVPAAD